MKQNIYAVVLLPLHHFLSCKVSPSISHNHSQRIWPCNLESCPLCPVLSLYVGLLLVADTLKVTSSVKTSLLNDNQCRYHASHSQTSLLFEVLITQERVSLPDSYRSQKENSLSDDIRWTCDRIIQAGWLSSYTHVARSRECLQGYQRRQQQSGYITVPP